MLAQSRDCTLNCVSSLATTHQSSSLPVACLQPRSCHSVWVQPQIPKLTLPHASLICLLSPLRLLNWQGNAWTRHSWMIPHSGQGKGRLFPWLNYFKPIQRKRKIPHEVKILSSRPSKGFPLQPCWQAKAVQLCLPLGVSGVAGSLHLGNVSSAELWGRVSNVEVGEFPRRI